MTAAPDRTHLVQAAWSLLPLLNEQAPLAEARGRLTDAIIAALHDTGLSGFYMPRCFGGAEAWPLEAIEIVEALSYADASTGWVAMALQVATATAAAYLPPESAQAIFGRGPVLIAGQGAPFGRADLAPGGFRLNGHWGYGSGIHHASWTHTGAMVHENGRPRTYPGTETPDARIFIVPLADSPLHENWNVLGLRATGSIDYSMENIFVPDAYTHRQNAKTPYQGGDLYRLGISGLSTSGHSGFALGVARRALDEIAAIAMAPKRTSHLPDLGGNDSFHDEYGHAEAELRAARAFVLESWTTAQRSLQRGNELSVRETTMIRMALNHATRVAVRVVDFAFKFAGGTAARDGALQRCFRDMHTGAQHITSAPMILRECAKELLGLSEGKVWGSRLMLKPE